MNASPTIDNNTDFCQPIINHNATIVFDKGWEAIPETIVFNLILFTFFLIIFIILRRLAWDKKVDVRWLQSIYGDRKLECQANTEDSPIIHHKHDLQINILIPPAERRDLTKEPSSSTTASISNRDILKSRGNDALQYLLFQQYIIYFLAILSIFCIFVVLPVNLQGNQFDSSQGFARTTLLNLPINSPLYWVHVIGASVISLIGIFMMHRFSKVIEVDEEQITRRTLLIRRVPKDKRNKELLAKYFRRVIPNCVIEGIQSVYDVRTLTPLTNQLTTVVNARAYCADHLEAQGKRLQMRPSCFGEFGCLCGCCCECCKQVDGIQYYVKAEEELQQKISGEMSKATSRPTGGFFITFQTERMAQEAFIHLKREQERAFSICPFSSSFNQLTGWCCKCLKQHAPADELEVSRWMVSYAPYPDDINWCDLTMNLRSQWLRSISVSLLLMVLFVFISTPTVILNASDTLKLADLFEWLSIILPSEIGSKVPNLVAPLTLVIAASALPAIVTLACQYIAYPSNSAKNHAIMWKVYLFLLLMVIIWPSLGLTSLKALILRMFTKDGKFPWNCLFPVSIGAFFVNYTIQYAFLGNIMELLRLPELLVYLWYKCIARSRAEGDTASRYVVWDFSIGIRYPRFLLIFAMVVTYSVSCPLIAVAGLVYMCIKHLIDRYNICYVYNPSKINSKIHATAILFVHIAFLMMQAQIFTVTLLRTGYSRVFGLAMFVFLVSLLVFSGHFFYYMFRNINHLTYRATRKQSTQRREYCACAYLPPVLYNLTRYSLNKSPSAASAAAPPACPEPAHQQPQRRVDANGDASTTPPPQAARRALGRNATSDSMADAPTTTTTTSSADTTAAANGGPRTATTTLASDGFGSSQLLLVPAIDTSDAYFLSGSSSAHRRPKFSQHTTMLSTRKHNKKSRRTASDGQQQFHPSRLFQYEELQLKRTNSDLDSVL